MNFIGVVVKVENPEPGDPEHGKKLSIDSLLKGNDEKIWKRSLSNEWGRLAAGNQHGTSGTNTIRFIH